MKTINVTITNYTPGTTCLVDEHPIVNDPDYCEVVETKAQLKYSYDGCQFGVTGKRKDTTESELIKQLIPGVILSSWLEEHCFDEFTQHGIKPPVVYDHEEDSHYAVNDIDNFVNNCKDDECYSEVMQKLQSVAEKEFKVNIIE